MSAYDEYLKQMERLADDAFKDHKVKDIKEGRWLIQRYNKEKHRWESFYWTEIVIVADGLLVHGDITTCLFKCFRGNKEIFGPINWVARSGVDYLEEKCSIGMDDKDVCRTFEDDVAYWEIEGHISCCVHDICEKEGYETPDIKITNHVLGFEITSKLRTPDLDDHEEWEDKIVAENLIKQENEALKNKIHNNDAIAAWLRAYSRIGGDHWELIRNDLYDDLVDAGESDAGGIVYNVGVVPDSRLFYARAACRKLVELLDTRIEENEQNKD